MSDQPSVQRSISDEILIKHIDFHHSMISNPFNTVDLEIFTTDTQICHKYPLLLHVLHKFQLKTI